MGYNARNDEIRDNVTRMRREWEAQRGALATVPLLDMIALKRLRVKPRDPEASVHIALGDVQCPRCNGHGRPRIIALAQTASI